MPEATSRSLVERFIEQVWNQNPPAPMDEFVAAPPSAYPVLYTYRGRDGVCRLLDEYRRAMPNSTLQINYFVGQGERVAVSVTMVIAHHHPEEGETTVTQATASEGNAPGNGTGGEGANGNGATDDAPPAEVLQTNGEDAGAVYTFFLFFQIVADKIISAQSSPAMDLLQYLDKSSRPVSQWERTLVALKLPPRLTAVLSFLVQSGIAGAAMVDRFWQRQWLQPIFRASVIILAFILFVWIGGRIAHRYAEDKIAVWLENDLYYLRLPQRTRQLSTVSADGTKLVFSAARDNLVPGDTNGVADIFVATANVADFDNIKQTGVSTPLTVTITQVSQVGKDGNGDADGWSRDPAITSDGLYVTFSSVATNLVSKSKSFATPINYYVRDLTCNTTYLVNDVLKGINNEELNRLSVNSQATCGDEEEKRHNIAFSLMNSPNALPPLFADATYGERQRLYEQQDRSIGLAERHLEIVLFYYVRYFSTILFSALAAIGAAVLLFFISRDGWNKHNDLLHIPFIGFVACSILFSAMPNVFEFSQNIEANKRAFEAAMTLENQIASYISTGRVMGQFPNPNDTSQSISTLVPLPASEFIHRVDAQLTELFGLAIEMNADEIPRTEDILEQMQGNAQLTVE